MTVLELKQKELDRILALIELGDLSLIPVKDDLEADIAVIKLQETGNNVQVLSPDDLETGTLQVETATVVGTITTSGNAAVVFTSAHTTGSPISLSVAVLEGDDPTAVAGKIKTALGNNANIAAKFTISGTGAAVVVTAKDYYGNDSTLNISIDNDTCVGLTTAATSANTTAGVAASDVLEISTGKVFCTGDVEGLTLQLPAAANVVGQEITIKKVDSGAGGITITTNSTEKIDGQDTYVLDDQYDVVTVVSDGSNFHITSKIVAD